MKLVVKVGTGVLTHEESGTLDGASIVHLVSALCELKQAGHGVVLVSSGAVGSGVGVLGLSEYPKELPLKQACAALGQTRLMQTYETLFELFGVHAAQLLLTADDLKHRLENVRATLDCLGCLGNTIPIVNENDTVSVEELRFGDNDALSVRLAEATEADCLLILSSIDGLYDPESGQLVARVGDMAAVMDFARDDRGKFSMGGMVSKLQSIRRAVEHGIGVYLLNGRYPERMARLLHGEGGAPGTWFVPQAGTNAGNSHFSSSR